MSPARQHTNKSSEPIETHRRGVVLSLDVTFVANTRRLAWREARSLLHVQSGSDSIQLGDDAVTAVAFLPRARKSAHPGLRSEFL